MYDQIAHYYDLTHADLTEDIDFILDLARQSNGPILELGCGSGRLLLPLARAGFMTVGVMREVGRKFDRLLDVTLMQIIF